MDTATCPFFIMMMLRLRSVRFFPSRQLILFTIFFFTQACVPQIIPLWETTPTPFRPPTSLLPTQPLSTTTPVPALFTPLPAATMTVTATAGPCTNGLTFLDDITVEDDTSFNAGAVIDKQWLVQNDGTCNWDSTYRLKWVGGNTLNAAEEQLIYPARAGTQATLRILFTAPIESGSYESAWQAVDPNGNFFGDLIFIKIVVVQ